MKYHCAVTLPINPPSALPTLTITQVWEGLIVKAREPQSFVPISECTITEDRGAAGITRRVKFVEGKGPVEGYVTEVITYHKPMKVNIIAPVYTSLSDHATPGRLSYDRRATGCQQYYLLWPE